MCSSKIIKKSLSKPSPLPVQLYRSILILSRTHTGILILLSSSWLISFNHSLSLSPSLPFLSSSAEGAGTGGCAGWRGRRHRRVQGLEAEVARAGAGVGCGGARHQQVLGPDEEAALVSRPEFLSKIPNAYMCVNPRPGISRGTQ